MRRTTNRRKQRVDSESTRFGLPRSSTTTETSVAGFSATPTVLEEVCHDIDIARTDRADRDRGHLRRRGKALAGGAQGGLVVSIALGFVGALLGPWVARQLNLAEPFMLHVSGQTFPIVWSIIGAALFVALLHLVSGRRWART
jgi:uncharacterized membrane protein YeaQ/YmgE (transglycosylase-associated protein family)